MTDQQQFQRVELTASLHEPKTEAGSGMTLFLGGKSHERRLALRRFVKPGPGRARGCRSDAPACLPGRRPAPIPGLSLRRHRADATAASGGIPRESPPIVDTLCVSAARRWRPTSSAFEQGDVNGSLATLHFGQLGQLLAVKTIRWATTFTMKAWPPEGPSAPICLPK